MIIETDSFFTINDHVSDETLLVVDIDNTLLSAATYHGSEAWERDIFKELVEGGMGHEAALDRSRGGWYDVQKNTPMRLMEDGIPSFLKRFIQEDRLIAITARDQVILHQTYELLKDFGLNFSEEGKSHHKSEAMKTASYPAHFHHGIAFCGDCPKGEVLFHILEDLGLFKYPKKVLMIDDRRENLEDVYKRSKERSIEFVGIHYGLASTFKYSM